MMKKTIIPAALFSLSVLVSSCSKQLDEPVSRAKPGHVSTVTSTSDAVTASVIFGTTVPSTVYLTAGWNTIQAGDFSVSGQTAYISKFSFAVAGGNPLLTGGKFYLNGATFPATISYSNDTITVAAKSVVALLPGAHSYILQAKIISSPAGSTFSMSLAKAEIVTTMMTFFNITGLPQSGNKFIMNKF